MKHFSQEATNRIWDILDYSRKKCNPPRTVVDVAEYAGLNGFRNLYYKTKNGEISDPMTVIRIGIGANIPTKPTNLFAEYLEAANYTLSCKYEENALFWSYLDKHCTETGIANYDIDDLLTFINEHKTNQVPGLFN